MLAYDIFLSHAIFCSFLEYFIKYQWENLALNLLFVYLDYLNLYDKGGVGQKTSKCDYVIWE